MRGTKPLILVLAIALVPLPATAATDNHIGVGHACGGIVITLVCADVTIVGTIPQCVSLSFGKSCVVRWTTDGQGSSPVGFGLGLPGNAEARATLPGGVFGGNSFCFWTVLPASCSTPQLVSEELVTVAFGQSVARTATASVRACVTGFGAINTATVCATANAASTVVVSA